MRPVAVAVVGIVALALGACDSPRSYLDSHDLSVAAQQVESLAAEAGWLSQQLRERSVTANMAWVHQQALGDDAAKVARQLARPTPPNLRAQQDELARLDAQIVAKVSSIAPAARDAGQLEALQREFDAIAAQARPLGQAS